MMDHLFHACDYLNAMVEDIANGGEGKKDVGDIVLELDKIEKGESLQDKSSTTENAPGEQQSSIKLDEFQLTILSESKEQGYENF